MKKNKKIQILSLFFSCMIIGFLIYIFIYSSQENYQVCICGQNKKTCQDTNIVEDLYTNSILTENSKLEKI